MGADLWSQMSRTLVARGCKYRASNMQFNRRMAERLVGAGASAFEFEMFVA
jgi:hypothetical protein